MTTADPKAEAQSLKAEGNKLFKQKQYLKAAGLYAKATRKDPNDPVLFCNLSAALLQCNKFSRAIESSEKCVLLDPKSEKGHYRMGVALVGMDRFSEAIEAFDKALEINPDNQEAMRKVYKASKDCRKQCKANGTEIPELALKYRPASSNNPPKKQGSNFAFKEEQSKPKKLADDFNVTVPETLSSADQVPQDLVPKLSSDEDVKNTMEGLKQGEAVKYDSQRVQRFVEAETKQLIEAQKDPKKRDQYEAPMAIFLPSVIKEGWEDEGSGVAINSGFDSADTHKQTITFLRNYGTKTSAPAVLIVAKKSTIAFPRVWTRKDKKWTYGEEGYFMQLDALKSDDRKMMFLEVLKDGSTKLHNLDKYYFSIVQPLLRDLSAATRSDNSKDYVDDFGGHYETLTQ